MISIPKDISEQVDREYTEIASKYQTTQEPITKQNLLWFKNLKNGLIEKIKNSGGILTEAYEWRLQLLAQHFSDATDLINEVDSISKKYKPSINPISYIPFTKLYKKRKEGEEKLELVRVFERELQDISKYIKYTTLQEITAHFLV